MYFVELIAIYLLQNYLPPKIIINPQAKFTVNNAIVPLTQVNSMLAAANTQAASPIAILYGKYASLKETALSQNLFTINNQQIFDVAGRTASPYNTNNLFAAAAIKKAFNDKVKLTLDTTYFFRNMNILITSAFVDFKDGQGYKQLGASPVSKVYTDSTRYKAVVYKVVCNDGNIPSPWCVSPRNIRYNQLKKFNKTYMKIKIYLTLH
jgi:hypothetical protein